MNPVFDHQAKALIKLLPLSDHSAAHLYLERQQMPLDIQDLVFAAAKNCSNINAPLLARLLEAYVSNSSFDERLLH